MIVFGLEREESLFCGNSARLHRFPQFGGSRERQIICLWHFMHSVPPFFFPLRGWAIPWIWINNQIQAREWGADKRIRNLRPRSWILKITMDSMLPFLLAPCFFWIKSFGASFSRLWTRWGAGNITSYSPPPVPALCGGKNPKWKATTALTRKEHEQSAGSWEGKCRKPAWLSLTASLRATLGSPPKGGKPKCPVLLSHSSHCSPDCSLNKYQVLKF